MDEKVFSGTLSTSGDIAKRLGMPLYKVKYCIERNRIEPTGHIGNAHVYDAAAVERIERLFQRRREHANR